MNKPNRLLSKSATPGLAAGFIMTVIASLRTRGPARTLLFAVLGIGIPVTFEYYSTNIRSMLTHHLQPQVRRVPVGIAFAWYFIGYNAFAMIESLAVQAGLPASYRRLVLPGATALTATSFDLVTDVAFLDQGYWEWKEGGPYAREISGPNGKHGIPLANFWGWLAVTSGVTWAYLGLSRDEGRELSPQAARKSGRTAALSLLPTYLMSVAWELGHGRTRHILYSALFPVVVALALFGIRGAKKRG